MCGGCRVSKIHKNSSSPVFLVLVNSKCNESSGKGEVSLPLGALSLGAFLLHM